MKEGINESNLLPPDAHVEFQGQGEDSDDFPRRVEQPFLELNMCEPQEKEIHPISALRKKLDDVKIRTAQKIFELRAAEVRKDPASEAQLRDEIHKLSTEHDAIQDDLAKLVAQAQKELDRHAGEPGTDEKTKTGPENVFATLPTERIVAIRDIVEEIPQLRTLYSSYRNHAKTLQKSPLRSNLFAQVEATLRRGTQEDIERAELMLYEGDDIEINPQSVSGLKPIINSIPNLKTLQDKIHHELITSKQKTGLARLFSGKVAITNIELVTSLIAHLRAQQDRRSKALLKILSYYSQKQKPR